MMSQASLAITAGGSCARVGAPSDEAVAQSPCRRRRPSHPPPAPKPLTRPSTAKPIPTRPTAHPPTHRPSSPHPSVPPTPRHRAAAPQPSGEWERPCQFLPAAEHAQRSESRPPAARQTCATGQQAYRGWSNRPCVTGQAKASRESAEIAGGVRAGRAGGQAGRAGAGPGSPCRRHAAQIVSSCLVVSSSCMRRRVRQ